MWGSLWAGFKGKGSTYHLHSPAGLWGRSQLHRQLWDSSLGDLAEDHDAYLLIRFAQRLRLQGRKDTRNFISFPLSYHWALSQGENLRVHTSQNQGTWNYIYFMMAPCVGDFPGDPELFLHVSPTNFQYFYLGFSDHPRKPLAKLAGDLGQSLFWKKPGPRLTLGLLGSSHSWIRPITGFSVPAIRRILVILDPTLQEAPLGKDVDCLSSQA